MPFAPATPATRPRVEFFALGTRDLASSRVRAWHLCEALSAQGARARCVVGPSVQGGARALLPGARDAIVIQKWAAPAALVRALRRRSGILLFDVDDAIYLDTRRGGPHATRNRERLADSLAMFDGFTVSTGRIAEDLSDAIPGKPVLVYPGPIEFAAAPDSGGRHGVVWLGSPATQHYLTRWATELAVVSDRHGFVAVGARPDGIRTFATRPWDPVVEREALDRARVGLFVQDEGTWEDRKSGYKIMEYVAHGVVPVAQRRAAAVELLGDDYPFLFDDDLLSAVDDAISLDRGRRDELLSALRARLARFTYGSVATTWLDFIGEIREPR